ncbi:phage integrase family domain protein [Mycobacterium xenopi 3993]|nr:phage integrase family domain protein [Mycobacterium xenopi 3993]
MVSRPPHAVADAGRPAPEDFIAYCATYGEDRFDFRPLPPRLQLEIQYAVQCRVDAQRAAPYPGRSKRCLTISPASGRVTVGPAA